MANNKEVTVQYNSINTNHDMSNDSNDDSTETQCSLQHHKKPKSFTTEPSVTINISDTSVTKEGKIGANLPNEQSTCLITFLKEYQVVFAWTYANMPELDPSIVEHTLRSNPNIAPKKSRLRITKPKLAKRFKDEIMKLLKVEFIEVSQYLQREANVAPVMKKDG